MTLLEPPLLGAVAALAHAAITPAVVAGLVEEEPAAAAHFGLIADVHALELAGEDFCRIERQGNVLLASWLETLRSEGRVRILIAFASAPDKAAVTGAPPSR